MIKMQSLDALDKGRAQESASCVQNVSRGFDALKRMSNELIQDKKHLKGGDGPIEEGVFMPARSIVRKCAALFKKGGTSRNFEEFFNQNPHFYCRTC